MRVQQRKAREASVVNKIKKKLDRIKDRQGRLGVAESTDHYIGWCCCLWLSLCQCYLSFNFSYPYKYKYKYKWEFVERGLQIVQGR